MEAIFSYPLASTQCMSAGNNTHDQLHHHFTHSVVIVTCRSLWPDDYPPSTLAKKPLTTSYIPPITTPTTTATTPLSSSVRPSTSPSSTSSAIITDRVTTITGHLHGSIASSPAPSYEERRRMERGIIGDAIIAMSQQAERTSLLSRSSVRVSMRHMAWLILEWIGIDRDHDPKRRMTREIKQREHAWNDEERSLIAATTFRSSSHPIPSLPSSLSSVPPIPSTPSASSAPPTTSTSSSSPSSTFQPTPHSKNLYATVEKLYSGQHASSKSCSSAFLLLSI
jgi:hypothetical protein